MGILPTSLGEGHQQALTTLGVANDHTLGRVERLQILSYQLLFCEMDGADLLPQRVLVYKVG